MWLHRLLLLAACWCAVSSYHVLVVFPVPSRSHDNLGRGVVRAIVNHLPGTQVTYITPYPTKTPLKGVREIDVSEEQKLADSMNMSDDDKRTNTLDLVITFGKNITAVMMATPAVRAALVDTSYDAVISEWFFNDAHAGLAAVLKCPWILFSGTVMHSYLEFLVDSFPTPAVLPFMMFDFMPPMTFAQRVRNTMSLLVLQVKMLWIEHANFEASYHEFFGPIAKARGVQLPDFHDALYNMSMLITNSHPSFAYPQSLPPNVIEVAGFHIDEQIPKLPEDLQKLMDGAKEGVVYFSMGSVLKSSKLPLEVRKQLIQVLGELPYTVLWKFEEPLENLPKNVHILKWAPQTSILAHPNIKLFITHGGLLSKLEAVNFGVPLLAIPMFGDQTYNANQAVQFGFGVKVIYSENIAADLRVGLKQILGDVKYHNKAKELSKLFRHRPMSPSKLVAHYVELAIETKGAYHLRPISRLVPLYQKLLLDQLAIVVAVLVVVVCAAKRLLRRLCAKKELKKEKKVKRN